MKAEKIFLPVFLLIIIGISTGIYFLVNSNVNQNLMENEWCVTEGADLEGTQCELVIRFLENGQLTLSFPDDSQVSGKWNYDGESLVIYDMKDRLEFDGQYSIEFKTDNTPTLLMSSPDVALMALGKPLSRN